jgi:large subunit ribosomal protein L20
MTRVKRGIVAHKKRERLLTYTKGFRWDRKSKERAAREALLHGWSRKFRGRKEKKRVSRTLWNVQINAAARTHDTSYRHVIGALKRKKIRLDRKILADLAQSKPDVFKQILKFVESKT